jgi:hypothetical protein
MANVVVFSRMDEELKRALEIQAKRERRSLSNLLVGAAEFYLRQHGAVVTPDALVALVPAAPAPAEPAQAAPSAAPAARLPATSQTARKPARKSPRSSARSSSRVVQNADGGSPPVSNG